MKASEHFDLPLEAHQEGLYQSDGTDETVAEFNTPEQAMIAARAINHANKLAEALSSLQSLIMASSASHLCRFVQYEEAKAALAAYRSAN